MFTITAVVNDPPTDLPFKQEPEIEAPPVDYEPSPLPEYTTDDTEVRFADEVEDAALPSELNGERDELPACFLVPVPSPPDYLFASFLVGAALGAVMTIAFSSTPLRDLE